MVRVEASAVLKKLVTGVGKGLAPFLKPLAGAWWLAQFDPHNDAAAAARQAFQAAFPGPKQREALAFCRQQILTMLDDNLAAAPDTLGDSRKETPEELAERHTRVQAASLLALSSLIDLTAGDNAEDGSSIDKLLSKQGFWKKVLASKAAPVRGNHASLWDMVLNFLKAFPRAWHQVDIRKAFLPKLYSFLRGAAYGSATGSLPAVLPLVNMMPKAMLGPSPQVLSELLNSTWAGWESQPAGASKEATAACFEDLLVWGLTKASELAGSAAQAQAYVDSLLQGALSSRVIPAALHASMDPSAQQQAAFLRTEQLLAALLSRLGASSQDVLLQQTVAPVAAALLGPVQAGSAPPSAATCLADLVRGFGPEVMAVAAARQEGRGRTTGPMELDLESVASACLTQSGEAAANVGLLRSCIQGSPEPAAALVKALKVFTKSTGQPKLHALGAYAYV
eukprot:jgi/Astpho2/8818/Aster-x0370